MKKILKITIEYGGKKMGVSTHKIHKKEIIDTIIKDMKKLSSQIAIMNEFWEDPKKPLQ